MGAPVLSGGEIKRQGDGERAISLNEN